MRKSNERQKLIYFPNLQEMDGKPGIAELKLSNLISCFAVGGLGLLMALIVMLLEKCWTIVNMPTMKKQLEPGQSAKISVSTADHVKLQRYNFYSLFDETSA